MLISLQILLLIENNYKVLETLESTSRINLLDQPLGSTSWIHIFENIFKGSQNTLLYRYPEMSDISRNE
jgi:hypothetical protein